MSGANTFGRFFRWTTFGESHGTAMGVVVDGCPAGVQLDTAQLQKALDRRRPGQIDEASKNILVTSRDEADQVQILSGLLEGKTLGTPIMCLVLNQNQKSSDYDKIKTQPRVGHADDVWLHKFSHSDHRGGGRASARETLSRVIAGNIAQQFLLQKHSNIYMSAFVRSIGSYEMTADDLASVDKSVQLRDFNVDKFVARFPQTQIKVDEVLLAAKTSGESYGGVVEVWIDGVPAGLGEPVFDKLKNQLASAMMSIGATCGFELGEGFTLSRQKGTQVHTTTASSVYGGIRGGISTGERIIFRVAFKPTSSIRDTAQQGRHDPCIVPRAVPVVEAMAWAVLADAELAQRSNKV